MISWPYLQRWRRAAKTLFFFFFSFLFWGLGGKETANFQKNTIITCWSVNVVRFRRCFLRKNPSSKSPVGWLPKGAVPAGSKQDQPEQMAPQSSYTIPHYTGSFGGNNSSPPDRTLTIPKHLSLILLLTLFFSTLLCFLSLPITYDSRHNYAYFIGWVVTLLPKTAKFSSWEILDSGRKGHWLEMKPWSDLHLPAALGPMHFIPYLRPCCFPFALLLVYLPCFHKQQGLKTEGWEEKKHKIFSQHFSPRISGDQEVKNL